MGSAEGEMGSAEAEKGVVGRGQGGRGCRRIHTLCRPRQLVETMSTVPRP